MKTQRGLLHHYPDLDQDFRAEREDVIFKEGLVYPIRRGRTIRLNLGAVSVHHERKIIGERERGEDKSMANTGADKKGNEDRTASKAGRAAAAD